MIATISRRSTAAREQWSDPRRRARLLATQLLAAERRRVDRLVRDNLHLLDLAAGHFSKKFPSIPQEDLAQAGFAGLRRAAEMFDPTKGAQFHTYAFFWLKATMISEFRLMRSTIRIPKRATAPAPRVTSLDAHRGDNDDDNARLIVDDDSASPLDLASNAELRDRIAQALKTLRPRHALVVALRFGLEGPPHTATEVARVLGISRSRAAQIERLALEKLRPVLFAE